MSDRTAELDRMTDHQAIISLEREFPGWMVYRGTGRLCHGRRRDDDGVSVRGEDWVDLRDMIRGWASRNAEE